MDFNEQYIIGLEIFAGVVVGIVFFLLRMVQEDAELPRIDDEPGLAEPADREPIEPDKAA